MKNKKKIIIIGLMCLMSLVLVTISFAVDDNRSDTEGVDPSNPTQKVDAGNVGLTYPYSGTNYTIKTENGETITLPLPAGTNIEGSENVKGYQSTGYDQCDIFGAAYTLPTGNLELSREDWAAIATAAGYTDLAQSILDGAEFYGFTEQYLVVSGGRTITATEAYTTYLNDPRYRQIANAIRNSFNSFTETDPWFLEQYMRLLTGEITDEEFTKILGIGGYHYEDESDKVKKALEAKKPEDEDPIRYVTEGLAGGGDGGSSSGTIDNSEFQVAAGEPIPTSETLTGSACSSVIGKVENLRTIHNEL